MWVDNKKHDTLISVSRPTNRDFKLYRGGSSARRSL
jgi:hypothetical protein